MSRITKRKYVTQQVMDTVLPTENQQIVQVTASPGNNLHSVVDSNGGSFLVSMPVKFRRLIFVKRGDYVIVDPIKEGVKVRGEIAHILFREHIHHIQDEGLWPDVFEYNKRRPRDSLAYVDDTFLPPSDSDDDELAFRVVNANKADVDSDSDCTDGGNKECDFDDCDVNIAACRNALSDECRVTVDNVIDMWVELQPSLSSSARLSVEPDDMQPTLLDWSSMLSNHHPHPCPLLLVILMHLW